MKFGNRRPFEKVKKVLKNPRQGDSSVAVRCDE